ncbi:MAG: lipid kinase, partial [Moraxellaceae bacterium]
MHDQKVNAFLIINPNSRKGAETDINTGIELLESKGFTVIQAESTSAENTAELIDQHHSEVDLVIIGGGDGSINSAAEALYRHQLTLAILPLGTANDLARSLDLPTNLTEAFKVIGENFRCKMDLGVANGHYFFNVANMGLGVGVSRELTPEVKKKWGVFSYLKA